MYCKKCGRELSADARYCPGCGAEQTAYDDPFTITEATEVEKKPSKVWTVFSIIGKVLGIVAIATSWIPYLVGLEIGIAGIVFSCLGRKANTDATDHNCRLGLKLSIAGIVISVVVFIVYIAIIIATGAAIGLSFTQGGY